MVILASAQLEHGTSGDLPQLAQSLFDIDCSGDLSASDELVLDSITATVQDELQRNEEASTSAELGYGEEDGRIGAKLCVMCNRGDGGLQCCPDTGKVASTSNFGSALGTSGVIKGQWMYEVTLATAGIQQVGWATLSCHFTTEEGVGDSYNSYAYDGKRRRKWNVRSSEYGARWAAGDVVGVGLDLEAREVKFWLNGESLGVAFTDVRTFEPHLAYFPALSLSEGEASFVNLGAQPLRYPVAGFRPFMAPPAPGRIQSCDWLLSKLTQLCVEPAKQDSAAPPLPSSPKSTSQKTRLPPSPRAAVAAVDPRLDVDRILLAGCLANSLSPYISDPYLIQECVLPWLTKLQRMDPEHLSDPASVRSPRARHCTPLATAVTILEAVLDDWELQALVRWSVLLLAVHALGETVGRDSPGSQPHVAIAATMLGSEGRATEVLLSWPDMHQALEWLLAVRRPSEAALRRELPEVLSEEGAPVDFSQPMNILCSRVEAIQRTQVALMRPLLFYPASAADSLASVASHRGSKTAFHALVIFLVQKNVGVLRQVPTPGMSHNSTLVNLFFVVLWFLGPAVRVSPHGSRRSSTDASGTPTAGSRAGSSSDVCKDAATSRPAGLAGNATADALRAVDGATAPIGAAAAPARSGGLPDKAAPAADQVPQAGGSACQAVDLTAIVTTRNSSGAASTGPSPRRNGSKNGRRHRSQDLDGGGTPRSRGHQPVASTFWTFPAGDFFLQDEAAAEPYLDLNRVGGILSEAAKNQPEDWEPLSVDASGVAEVLRSSGLAAHNLHSDTPQRHTGPLAAHLVDLAALLYTVGLQISYQRLSAQVRNIQEMHAGLSRLNDTIADADRRAAAAATRAGEPGGAAAATAAAGEPGTDVAPAEAAATPDADPDRPEHSRGLRETRAKAVSDIETEIRLLEWHQRAAVHGGWKSAAVLQISLYLAHMLRQIQESSPNVWSHVPEMYVEFAVCAHHALQRHTQRALKPATRHVALLLSRLLGDPRVVTPTMRDVVLQSVTNLLASSAPLSAVADDDEVMGHLLPGIFQLFGPEHWTTLAPTLLRAMGHESPPGTSNTPDPSPSSLNSAAAVAIRRRIADLCAQRDPAAMHFVQSLFSALDWAVTEVSVCLRAVASRRGAHSSSQKRRLLVFFSIAVTCTQLVEFLVASVPTLFLQGPPVLADRLAEMLAFLVVHAPVDSSSDDYKAITSAADSVDHSTSRFLHPLVLAQPLVAILASLWRQEAAAADGGDPPLRVDNSVVDRLCGMAAACPNQYLAALPDALLQLHSGSPAIAPVGAVDQHLNVLRARCSVVSTMVESFIERRAKAGGGGDEVEDDVPADFVDPITMAVMADPVQLPDSKVVLDRGTIERHLEENGTDPYSREPLAVRDIVEMPELRAQIQRWQADKAAAAQLAAAAAVSGSGQGSVPGEGGMADSAPLARQRRMDAKVAADTIRSHVPDSWDVDSDEEEVEAAGAAARAGQQREE
eukprot:jgi/Ulvmu1/6878/UM031_0083.1